VFGTHLGRGYVLRDAARWGRPVAYYMQLGRVPRHLLYGVPELTVFNSRFLQREYAWMRGGMLLHPPIDEADYLITRGDAITLVNPLDRKGGQLVFDLATRIPGRQFLTVRNWGAEPLPECPPPNVTVLETQADMRVVYARTRILLVASSYESYGRVGLEAAVSGIPTIAHDLGALRESLADAAIWIDPGAAPDEWIARINELDDPATYAQWSARARRRFEELDPAHELDQLERALVGLATNGPRTSGPLQTGGVTQAA
jgi:glycosyltransferase involved in cell wall biosynthesis